MQAFLNVAARKSLNLTFNEKIHYFCERNQAVGLLLSHDSIKPDPDRSKPLMKLPLPSNGRELKRVLCMFAYYTKWIPTFLRNLEHFFRQTAFRLQRKQLNLLKH